jgi:hypothetical protein
LIIENGLKLRIRRLSIAERLNWINRNLQNEVTVSNARSPSPRKWPDTAGTSKRDSAAGLIVMIVKRNFRLMKLPRKA